MTTRTPTPRLPALGPAVAGYRLDELIGIGESANVYAGMLDVGGGQADAAGRSDPVAVKLCLTSVAGPPGVGQADGEFGREAECRALALRPIAGMPRLLDLGTTERGELVLVMTLCRGRPAPSSASQVGSLAVDAGELSQLVRELHEAGVAHGGLDPGAVLVADDGAHSLVGFCSARFAGEAGFEAAVGADLRAVTALAHGRPAVVSFSTTTRPTTAGQLPSQAGAATSSPRAETSLHEEAFVDVWRWADDTVEESGRQLAFLETLEPAVLAIRESGAALRGLVRNRSAGAMVPRRRRFLAAGAALVVAAAVTGCLLLPSGGSDAAAMGEAAVATSSAVGAASGAAVVQADGSPTVATSDAGAEASQAAVRSDDPVSAVSALLAARRECLRVGEPKCLDAVDQWNSPALLADQDVLRGSGPPDDPLASVSAVELVERIGATALLRGSTGDTRSSETTKPVSLLVMRSETGWRFRSYRVGQGPD